MTCKPCAHAAETGWFGQPGAHCRKCHRSWTALKQAHCPTCCAHFSTPNLFDAHLLTRGCQDPATVTRGNTDEPRFRQDEAGIWRDSQRMDPDASPFTEGKAETGESVGGPVSDTATPRIEARSAVSEW